MSVSGSAASDHESDVEMQSALSVLGKKTSKKAPTSPSEGLLKKNQDSKKMTTKDMILEVLAEQKSRKGISLHAIKKFIVEKHTVNVDRITYLIKKNLKAGIEDGSIIQTKGMGASGSFRLAPKKKPEKTEKPKTSEKTKKVKKTKKEAEKKESAGKKGLKKKTEIKTKKEKPDNKEKPKKKTEVKEKKEKSKMAKEKQTPAKKRANMMKRKSIGSIIKPPKMKPKAQT